MLEAYMDESGIHDGAHTCVIAGFWGGENQWRGFENSWQQIIRDAGLVEFHSVEFWERKDGKRTGVYENWDDTRADRLISDLLNCIEGFKIYPTTSAVPLAAWKELTRDERMLLTGGKLKPDGTWEKNFGAPNKPYFLPFQWAVYFPAKACKASLRVHYAFDLNKQFKTHASQLFAMLKNWDITDFPYRDRLGEISFPTSHEAPGLQAADLLAYRSYQFSVERASNPEGVKLSDLKDPILHRIVRKAQVDKTSLDASVQNLRDRLAGSGDEFLFLV